MVVSLSKYGERLPFDAAHFAGQHHLLAPAPATFALREPDIGERLSGEPGHTAESSVE